tara:strand:+ start:50778 stop:50942 length:165 start_codon:yes stop_codon:yes gene_type:complete
VARADDNPLTEDPLYTALRRSIAEFRAGRVRDIDEVLDTLETRAIAVRLPTTGK